ARRDRRARRKPADLRRPLVGSTLLRDMRDRPAPYRANRHRSRVGTSRWLTAQAALLGDHLVEIRKPVQPGQRPGHSVVMCQSFPVPLQKPPVAGRERTGAVATPNLRVITALAAIVAHPVDIGTAR